MTELSAKNVIVTGGAGFIGSNLANTLAEENAVTVIDDCYLGTPEHLDDQIDFYDQSVLDEELPISEETDVIFHLAALSSLKMHTENPVQGATVNVSGFVNVVEQARQAGVEDVVYATTSSIYGSRTDPSGEWEDVEARTNYEASKLAREKYADAYEHRYGLNLAGLRFFSVYQGYGGAEGHKGEYANVIAQFADSLANGDAPVLYGDGTQTRDFTHVDDVVRACMMAPGHSGVFNVGTSDAHSFNEVVDRLNRVLGTDIEPEYVENPIPDHVYVHDTCAATEKIREVIGWEPTISFDEGLQRVCQPYTDVTPLS